jgi:hypothetical protein
MAVMVVVFFTLDNRNHATMSGLTNGVFELDRRVVDTEVAQQALFHIAQDAFTD